MLDTQRSSKWLLAFQRVAIRSVCCCGAVPKTDGGHPWKGFHCCWCSSLPRRYHCLSLKECWLQACRSGYPSVALCRTRLLGGLVMLGRFDHQIVEKTVF